jgi:hypothetical protein
VAVLALGSLAVLLDAGAKYSGEIWPVATLANERAAVERDDSSSDYAPYPFRLSATLPIDRARLRCADEDPRADSSQSGDESFDINCIEGTNVRAVGDFPRAELLSWRGNSGYDRAVRF